MKTTMKKLLFALAAVLTVAACVNKKTASSAAGGSRISNEVAFEIAKNYFFNNGQEIPANPIITTEKDFSRLFGMATLMGENGKPTEIDFNKQFVLAVVLPITNIDTEITPVRVEEKGDSLVYTYEVKTGEKQSYSTQPMSAIIIDKKYADKEIKLVSQQK